MLSLALFDHHHAIIIIITGKHTQHTNNTQRNMSQIHVWYNVVFIVTLEQ